MAQMKAKVKDGGKNAAARNPHVKGKAKVKGKNSAAEIKREKDIARLNAWSKKAREDPAYRKRMNEAERKRKQALRDDAELGRACRMFFEGFMQMLEIMRKEKE